MIATIKKEECLMKYLFCLIELISMLMTAFIGTCFYVAGFFIALLYVAVRWLFRTVREVVA